MSSSLIYPSEFRHGYATAHEALVALTKEGSPTPVSGRRPRGRPRDLGQGIGCHRRAGLRRLFPDRLRHCAFRRVERNSLSGPRFGCQFSRLLLPRHYSGQSGAGRASVRALHVSGAPRSRPTSTSISNTSAAKRSSSMFTSIISADMPRMTATVISYRSRSAIRDVGKVFGLSKDVLDVLTSSIWGWSMEGVTKEQAARAGLDASDPRLNQTLAMAERIAGVSASSFPARRWLCHFGNASRRDRSDRERRDGRSDGDRMGQGRSRYVGNSQGRCSRPWHVVMPAPRARSHRDSIMG